MIWTLIAATATAAAIAWWRPSPAGRLRAPPDEGAGRQPWQTFDQRTKAAAAIGASCALLALGLGVWALIAVPLAGVVSYFILGRLQTAAEQKRADQLRADLPAICDLLGVCLESGLPLRRATSVLAAVMPAPGAAMLGEVAAKVRLGQAESTAWAELVSSHPAGADLGREVSRSIEAGIALSQTLAKLGHQARQDAATTAEVRARRVGVRSVLPLMLCYLPAFLLLGVVPIIGGVASQFLG